MFVLYTCNENKMYNQVCGTFFFTLASAFSQPWFLSYNDSRSLWDQWKVLLSLLRLHYFLTDFYLSFVNCPFLFRLTKSSILLVLFCADWTMFLYAIIRKSKLPVHRTAVLGVVQSTFYLIILSWLFLKNIIACKFSEYFCAFRYKNVIKWAEYHTWICVCRFAPLLF